MTKSRGWRIASFVAGMIAATSCSGRTGSKPAVDGGAAGAPGDSGIISRGDARADADGPDGPPVVDPAVSGAWTWSPCGTLAPAPADLHAVFGLEDKIAVQNERGVRVFDRSGTLQPEADGPADFLITSPDGEALVARVTQAAITLGPVGSSAPRFTFAIPVNRGCGTVSALSWRGAYLLSRSAETACVWSAADGAFVTALPIVDGEAALRGDHLVSFAQPASRSPSVVTRDFAGRETSRLQLGELVGAVSIAPSGDRLLTWDPPALWDLDSGKIISWSTDPIRAPAKATFSPAGDLVLLGAGVFRTSDGSLVRPVDPDSRIARFAFQAFALSPDGKGAVLGEFGRATLESLSAPGLATVLGGPPPPLDGSRPRPINHIASSADGSLLVANVLANWAFGVRLAPDFATSRIASMIFTEVNVDVDVSADGAIAAIAGDGRALFGAQDGRIIWSPPVPPPNVPSCSTEKLRLSPKKTWAAGASYLQTMDVFPVTDMAGVEAPLPLFSLPSGCGDSAVFSRDERLMATSTPALYRTATTSTAWQKVWSGPEPAKVVSGFDPDRQGFSNDVRFSPDESQLLVSRCPTWDTCSSTLLDVASGAVVRELPQLTGPHPAFSPDGSWIVGAGTLLHLPTGDTRTLSPVGAPPDASNVPPITIVTALFTPDGNIIAGSSDGSLTRYCRSP